MMKEQVASQESPKHQWGQSQGKLLLICDGPGTIVFAHGDASMLGTNLDHLRHKHFFSLGFSQYSLLKIQHLSEGGVLDPPKTRSSFIVELVKPVKGKITYQQFCMEQDSFLKSLQLKCSLMQVKFSQGPLQAGTSKVSKGSINTLRENPNQHRMTLIEIYRPSRMSHLKTTYEDYILTCKLLSKETESLKKEEK